MKLRVRKANSTWWQRFVDGDYVGYPADVAWDRWFYEIMPWLRKALKETE